MIIAATFDNGEIFPHFGRTEKFKFYQAENGRIVSSRVVDTEGAGHGALAQFLRDHGADVLVCGGMGGGAKAALADAGITVYGGVSGGADEAVAALLQGTLSFDNQSVCSHHEHEGGEHDCHGAGCGKCHDKK